MLPRHGPARVLCHSATMPARNIIHVLLARSPRVLSASIEDCYFPGLGSASLLSSAHSFRQVFAALLAPSARTPRLASCRDSTPALRLTRPSLLRPHTCPNSTSLLGLVDSVLLAFLCLH